jgi:hypothetical protein
LVSSLPNFFLFLVLVSFLPPFLSVPCSYWCHPCPHFTLFFVLWCHRYSHFFLFLVLVSSLPPFPSVPCSDWCRSPPIFLSVPHYDWCHQKCLLSTALLLCVKMNVFLKRVKKFY